MAAPARRIEIGRRPFEEWCSDFLRGWSPGSHLVICGPTGSGKTYVKQQLLLRTRRHPWQVIFGTKVRDRTLDRFISAGYMRIEKWPPPAAAKRVILWPKIKKIEHVDGLKSVFAHALERIFVEQNTLIDLDELRLLAGRLGLARIISDIEDQGRSMGITITAGAQRPSHVPVTTWSMASDGIIYRTGDGNDRRRLAELGSADADVLRQVLRQVEGHEFAHVATRRSGLIQVSGVKACPDPLCEMCRYQRRAA